MECAFRQPDAGVESAVKSRDMDNGMIADRDSFAENEIASRGTLSCRARTVPIVVVDDSRDGEGLLHLTRPANAGHPLPSGEGFEKNVALNSRIV
jgi:hypothetical protein